MGQSREPSRRAESNENSDTGTDEGSSGTEQGTSRRSGNTSIRLGEAFDIFGNQATGWSHISRALMAQLNQLGITNQLALQYINEYLQNGEWRTSNSADRKICSVLMSNIIIISTRHNFGADLLFPPGVGGSHPGNGFSGRRSLCGHRTVPIWIPAGAWPGAFGWRTLAGSGA